MPKLTPPVTDSDHIQGPANASLTLLEFGDYQCPHCGAAYPIIKEIQNIFGKRLRFVFRNFPLSNVHELALRAAIAAEAAGRQERFWEMHDMVFEHQRQLTPHSFAEFAQEIKLDISTFKRDLQDKKLAYKVEADFESGIRSGVNGTPSFFINEQKYEGSYDFGSLAQAIKETMELAHG
jgi:protein-disulfide isomerase